MFKTNPVDFGSVCLFRAHNFHISGSGLSQICHRSPEGLSLRRSLKYFVLFIQNNSNILSAVAGAHVVVAGADAVGVVDSVGVGDRVRVGLADVVVVVVGVGRRVAGCLGLSCCAAVGVCGAHCHVRGWGPLGVEQMIMNKSSLQVKISFNNDVLLEHDGLP